MSNICAVIPAAGKGSRMGCNLNKQFIELKGKPIILRTIDVFCSMNLFNRIVVVLREEEILYFEHRVLRGPKYKYKSVCIAKGGETRQDSVLNGLLRCPEHTDIVVIHDGARPLITPDIICSTVEMAKKHKAVITAVPVTDTVKEACEKGVVKKTLDRDRLWAVQTPQVFDYALILKAHEVARQNKLIATDDSRLVEELGVEVKIHKGSYHNIKITTQEDLIIAEQLLSRRGF